MKYIRTFSHKSLEGETYVAFSWPPQFWFQIAQLYQLGCTVQHYCPFRKFITNSAVLNWQELFWPSRCRQVFFISVLTFRIRQSGLFRDVSLLQLSVYTGCHLLVFSL